MIVGGKERLRGKIKLLKHMIALCSLTYNLPLIFSKNFLLTTLAGLYSIYLPIRNPLQASNVTLVIFSCIFDVTKYS